MDLEVFVIKDQHIQDSINQHAERAIRSAFATFESLYQIAILYVQYYNKVEQIGWPRMMLEAAQDKTYGTLPKHACSLWHHLKRTSRASFQRFTEQTALPLQ
jgi:hypothetical protein